MQGRTVGLHHVWTQHDRSSPLFANIFTSWLHMLSYLWTTTIAQHDTLYEDSSHLWLLNYADQQVFMWLPFKVLIFFLGVTVDSYSCLDPGIPVNGIRYGQDFSIGSTVSFGCDSGYRLSHEEPLVCEKNHWWSHPLPTCDGKCLKRSSNLGGIAENGDLPQWINTNKLFIWMWYILLYHQIYYHNPSNAWYFVCIHVWW